MRKKKAPEQRLAAIDIGSNAIRLMLAAHSASKLKPIKKYRVAIRLGSDVFAKGKISEKNLKDSAKIFQKFRQIVNKAGIQKIRAVGTSALREAKNNHIFVKLIHLKSGLNVEIIDGVKEAQLIYLAVKKKIQIEKHNCLLIDVGGGSVELTFSDKGRPSSVQSFPFGTVRTLQKLKLKKLTEKQIRLVIGEYIQPLSHFILSHNSNHRLDFAVGTGGNLEALGRMKSKLLKKKSQNSLTIIELNEIIEKLSKMSLEERIEKLKLRKDRADVILPAALITQTCMQLAGVEKIMIPYVGLKDGLLWSMVHS